MFKIVGSLLRRGRQLAIEPQRPFDFEVHGNDAATVYARQRHLYIELSEVVQRLVKNHLEDQNIQVSSVDARAKEVDSFRNKARSASDYDPEAPKYRAPLLEIDDLAGVRIVSFLPNAADTIDAIICKEFDIFERSDKGAPLIEEGRFGYRSIHYLVTLKLSRTNFGRYRRFRRVLVEIQLRTILQHAWAEIEHDIQYKSAIVMPVEINRRFMTLAGLLEMADREFQAIQDEDSRIRQRERIRGAKLDSLQGVELTPEAVRAYLDAKLGPDAHVSEFSYDWATRLLKGMGFKTLDQVDGCVSGSDVDVVSRILYGTLPGQIMKLQALLLASMGQTFVDRHLDADEELFRVDSESQLHKLTQGGIAVGGFDPIVDR